MELEENSAIKFDKSLTYNGYFDIAVVNGIRWDLKANKVLFYTKLLAEKER